MKKIHRILSVVSAAVVSAAAFAMFAGCDSAEPEVTITYSFLGEDYEVEYTLSRKGAPQTVQHFIELADAGYYDGTCIHSYESSYLYGGAYVYNEETKSIVEKDYYNEVKDLKLTQTVYTLGEDGKRGEPLYTVRGEFSENGVEGNTKTLTHQQGALAMYYTSKGDSRVRVGTIRSDGGSDNNGEEYQSGDYYKYNCTTSMFYTFTGAGTLPELDKVRAVIGMRAVVLEAVGEVVLNVGGQAALAEVVDDGRGDALSVSPVDGVGTDEGHVYASVHVRERESGAVASRGIFDLGGVHYVPVPVVYAVERGAESGCTVPDMLDDVSAGDVRCGGHVDDSISDVAALGVGDDGVAAGGDDVALQAVVEALERTDVKSVPEHEDGGDVQVLARSAALVADVADVPAVAVKLHQAVVARSTRSYSDNALLGKFQNGLVQVCQADIGDLLAGQVGVYDADAVGVNFRGAGCGQQKG